MEYSNSAEERLNIQGLLEDLHQVVIDCDLFLTKDVKSRAIRIDYWFIGDKEDMADFIHLTVELLAGRTEEQRKQLSGELIRVLAEQASHISSLTINVREMDNESFQKIG